MTFKNQLKKLKACQEALEWVGNKTIEEAWETCENQHWMLWFLTSTFDITDFLCDIAEGVLHLVPEEHRLACSNAISAVRRRANIDELNAAAEAARSAYYATSTTAYSDTAFSATAAAHSASGYASSHSSFFASNCSSCAAAAAAHNAGASDAVSMAARYADGSASRYVDGADGTKYNEEKKKQCDILRKYFTIDQVKEAFNKLVNN